MKYWYIAKSAFKHLRSGFNLPYMVMFETTLMCNMFCEYCIFGEEGKFNDLQIVSGTLVCRLYRRPMNDIVAQFMSDSKMLTSQTICCFEVYSPL